LICKKKRKKKKEKSLLLNNYLNDFKLLTLIIIVFSLN